MKGAKYLLEDTSIHGNDLYEFAKMTFDCTSFYSILNFSEVI